MAERIFKGHSCCKDRLYPKKSVSITPRFTTLQRGEDVWLTVKGVHRDCDGGCFTWKLESGGGILLPLEGLDVTYYPPETNELCAASARILLICGGEPIADAYISTNTNKTTRKAYEVYVKMPRVELTPPREGWPPTNLPPPPPMNKPPAHVTFAEGFHFPKPWKRGDPMPPGASIDLKKLIPKDWTPDQIQPPGVIIPGGTVFPPDWRPGDELPAECRPNTFEIFPEGFLTTTPSDRIRVHWDIEMYYCNDIKFGFRYTTQMWFVSWNTTAERWQINPPSGTGVKPVSAWYKIPWESMRAAYPKYVDYRSTTMKEGGCCPGGLLKGQVEQEEKEQG